MADERVKLEVAFEGGVALSVSVPAGIADDLDKALASGDGGSITFEADDGRYTVAVKKIIFVKRHLREGRVGFGA